MIRTLEQRLVYENEYAKVFDDLVEFPDGSRGTYYYPIWKAPYGVAIVAVADGKVLMIRNYRYSDRSYSLEIPAGFGVAERSPAEQARIELKEETGLEAVSMEPLLKIGGSYSTHVFLALISDPSMIDPSGQESSEDIVGYEWLELKDISPKRIEELGIYEPTTIASLFATRVQHFTRP